MTTWACFTLKDEFGRPTHDAMELLERGMTGWVPLGLVVRTPGVRLDHFKALAYGLWASVREVQRGEEGTKYMASIYTGPHSLNLHAQRDFDSADAAKLWTELTVERLRCGQI